MSHTSCPTLIVNLNFGAALQWTQAGSHRLSGIAQHRVCTKLSATILQACFGCSTIYIEVIGRLGQGV